MKASLHSRGHGPSGEGELRAARPDGAPTYVIMDNLSANKTPTVRAWAARHKVELYFTPTYTSWVNLIEAQFGPLCTCTMGPPTIRTTRRWRAGCRPICAGATPKRGIPTCWPTNAGNGPGSEANATDTGGGHTLHDPVNEPSGGRYMPSVFAHLLDMWQREAHWAQDLLRGGPTTPHADNAVEGEWPPGALAGAAGSPVARAGLPDRQLIWVGTGQSVSRCPGKIRFGCAAIVGLVAASAGQLPRTWCAEAMPLRVSPTFTM